MHAAPLISDDSRLTTEVAGSSPSRQLPSSFRDRSGFVYRSSTGELLRQVNSCCSDDYLQLVQSGLYQDLVDRNLLIPHEEVSLTKRATHEAFAILKPQSIPFISYPYEWSFSALKAAALATLEIQERALNRGMSLKDASAFNIQFLGNRPVFIDTLSFETYRKGTPWQAYGQFCRHFLAPLALMSRCDIRLQNLLQTHLDGIPLDLARKLLPWSSWFSPGLAIHLHLHAGMVQKRAATRTKAVRQEQAIPAEAIREASVNQGKQGRVSAAGLRGILASLKGTISKLNWKSGDSAWLDYYDTHTYSDESESAKLQFVQNVLDSARPGTVWDMGANTGLYSKLASKHGCTTIAFDYDPACIDRLFNDASPESERVLPLVMNLENPSSGLGWGHRERDSLLKRGPADLTLALALIHHLAIGNNLPFTHLAEFFHRFSRSLVIEYVPPTDPQVLRLLRTRQTPPHPYGKEEFEGAFLPLFECVSQRELTSGEAKGRILYYFRARD